MCSHAPTSAPRALRPVTCATCPRDPRLCALTRQPGARPKPSAHRHACAAEPWRVPHSARHTSNPLTTLTIDAAAQALLGKAPTQHAPMQPPMPPPPPAASSGSDTNYQGLTNEEDFEQVATATKVNIISCPYHETNPVAGRKAAATKDFHDNAAAGIYTFNPNSGLKAAAEARNMTPDEQGKKWLELWTEVAMKVQETGGTCFVI
eukprot:4604248-Prymnesium_polylepis.1